MNNHQNSHDPEVRIVHLNRCRCRTTFHTPPISA